MTGVNGTNKAKMPKPVFPAEAASKEYAASLDAKDPLNWTRDLFIIPSKANLASKKLAKPGELSIHEVITIGWLIYILKVWSQVSQRMTVSTSAATRWVFSLRLSASTWKLSWIRGHQSVFAVTLPILKIRL